MPRVKTDDTPTTNKAIDIDLNYVKVPKSLLGTKGNELFYGETEFYIRPFTTGEVRQLALMTEENADEITNQMLSRIIKIDGDITYGDIISSDKLSFVFLARTLTYPEPNFVINYVCDNEIDKGTDKGVCGAENKLHFSMEDVEINYIREPITKSDFIFTCSDGKKIYFRMPTINDEKIIEENRVKMIDILKKEKKKLDMGLFNLACIIEDIEDNDIMKSIKGFYDFLFDMKAVDTIKMQKHIKTLQCGIDTEIKTTCEECGGKVSVPVIFSTEFFLPDYTD